MIYVLKQLPFHTSLYQTYDSDQRIKSISEIAHKKDYGITRLIHQIWLHLSILKLGCGISIDLSVT